MSCPVAVSLVSAVFGTACRIPVYVTTLLKTSSAQSIYFYSQSLHTRPVNFILIAFLLNLCAQLYRLSSCYGTVLKTLGHILMCC
jgi:hypothetical protein